MQFLITSEAVEIGPTTTSPQQLVDFLERVIRPSFQMFIQWEKEGRMHGGAFPGERRGAMILEAASPEEAHTLISSLPMWGTAIWKLHALIPTEVTLRTLDEQLGKMKQMMAGGPPGGRPGA